MLFACVHLFFCAEGDSPPSPSLLANTMLTIGLAVGAEYPVAAALASSYSSVSSDMKSTDFDVASMFTMQSVGVLLNSLVNTICFFILFPEGSDISTSKLSFMWKSSYVVGGVMVAFVYCSRVYTYLRMHDTFTFDRDGDRGVPTGSRAISMLSSYKAELKTLIGTMACWFLWDVM